MSQEISKVLAIILLAIVQGFAEFLPISSDGHLVLAGYLLGSLDTQFLNVVIFLHGGSLLVLLAHYRRELFALATRTLVPHPDTPELRSLLGALAIATLITGAIGWMCKDAVSQLQDPVVAACGLLLTGLALLSLQMAAPGGRRTVNIGLAVLIGLAQGLAILPGVSRSGLTITVGLWAGLEPALAARFSFLLAIPAISGALLLDLRQLKDIPFSASQLGIGFVVCVVASWIALRLVLRFTEQGRLTRFGIYCLGLGTFFLLYSSMFGSGKP